MSARTPTRLEIHRLKRRWTGGINGPLPTHELSEQERDRIREDIYLLMLVHRWDFLSARSHVYADWGIVGVL